MKRYLRKLLKRIYIILSKLARSFSKKRRKIRRGFGHELSHKTNNIYAKNTNIAKLEEKTKSEFQSAQPISSYKEDNVVQNSKGDGNILVGVVGGNLTINYRRPVDRPFQAPNLPTNFVDRPDISRSLKAGLLANTTSNSGVLLVSALHGLGGIGKTTLVAALAHDTDIQKRFSGGVLWATLGQTPDIISLLSSWVKALGDYEFPARTIEETSNHLRGLLQEKAVLLVVDDVWDSDHLKPFLVASSQSQVIVTSRRVDVADGVTAKLTELNLMTPEESLALLSKSLERELITGEGQEALQVAKAVGYLPLALNLVAARVKRGVAWSELEAALKAEVARLEELEGPRSKQALEATFNLSLKALKDYSEAAWHNFIWLGVLPEDVTITAPMTANLWDISVTDAKKRLELLWNDALLQSNSPVEIAGASWNSYRMHDLLHDVARRLLTSTAGIGISLPEAHRKLLARYQQKTQNGQWHTLADDGYIHQRLVWHLEQAQWTEEIHQLLRETAANGRNGWYEARERLGQTAGYISDISRIWEIVDANQTPTSKIIGWQCRYALIVASLNSLAKNIPPALLVALVRKQVWTPEQGLAYALQIPEPQQKVTALTELAEIENCLSVILKEKALQSALKAAQAIEDERYRADALSAIAPKLPETFLPEALKAAQAFEYERYRAEALIAIAPKLPESLLPEALKAAQAIEDERYRAYALIAIAPKLPETLLPEALKASQGIESEYLRAEALSAIADKLPEVLPEALKAALAIEHEYYRAEALRAIADKLPEMLPEALKAAQAIESECNRVRVLIAIAPKLPEMLPEALKAAQAIEEEYNRAEALRALAPHLSQMPEVKLFSLWKDTLHSLSLRTRPNLLRDLAELEPVIFALGGEAVLEDLFHAIQDVAKWWR
nr:NB-ARC domain-containing protein [Planktothrix sp. FACHB-1355]